MSVRAKFVCEEVDEQNEDEFVIRLGAVYDPDPESENGKFFQYTPWGTLEFGTINGSAAKQFEVGQEYYIDISPGE